MKKDFTEEESRERSQKLQRRAMAIAESIASDLRDRYPDGAENIDDFSDVDALAMAYAMLSIWANTFDSDRPGQTCGWCIKAAGNDQAAWDAAQRFDGRAAIEAHTVECKNNPLVKRIAELTAELAEHYPVAISARAWAADEATQSDLRNAIDKIDNGDAATRLAHLPPRLGGTYGKR